MTQTSRTLIVTAVALFAAAAGRQGAPAEIPLGTRNGAIIEPFSDLTGLAELNDGRVIVSDRTERLLVLADLGSGSRRTIGNNGAGPKEYQVPWGPIRWRGDTLLAYDPFGHRYLRLLQDGAIHGTIELPPPSGLGYAVPKGVDATGRLYWESSIIDRVPVIKRSMKANVIRWLPGSDSLEPAMQINDHAEFEHRFRYRPMPQADAWVLARDGRIGVVSAAEYRLRWYRDGKLEETGDPIPYTPVRVTSAERNAFRARKASEPSAGGMSRATSPEGAGAVTMARINADWGDTLFPPQMPPFEAGAALMAANGDIWLRRSVAASERSPRVDVLDARGRLRGVVRLPPRSRLLALGAASVYLVVEDDDGLQTLERYPWPAALR